jgi:predicted lactoylglutathione lyase
MSRLTFVSLPVAELARSLDFFGRLGFEVDPAFTDEQAGCLVVSDRAFVMLVVEPFFSSFTRKPVADAATSTESVLGVSAASREEVDSLVDRALALGATVAAEPQDHGSTYGRSFYDLDGHAWEVLWFAPA